MSPGRRRPGRGQPGDGSEHETWRGLADESTSRWRAQVLDRHEPSYWLRRAIAAALTPRRGEACLHADTAGWMVTAVWTPGRFVCGGCTALLVPPPADDLICDRCGGDSREHGITLLIARYTIPLAFDDAPPRPRTVDVWTGLCRECATREGVPA